MALYGFTTAMDGRGAQLRKAKSIKRIMEEISGADLVLTAEPSLATAINRCAGPRIGRLAYTPRQWARQCAPEYLGQAPLEPHQEIIALADLLDCDIREADNIVRRSSSIHRRSADPGKDIAMRGLTQGNMALASLPTLSKAMRMMGPGPLRGMRIAIVGKDKLDNLDRMLIPGSFDNVDLFENGEVSLGDIHRFPDKEQLIRWLVSGIDPDNASSVAILLSFDSPYLNMVRAALVRKGVPVNITGTLDQDQITRGYLDLVEMALNLEGRTTEELAHALAHMGVTYSPGECRLLDSLRPEERPGLDWLWDVEGRTFNETLDDLAGLPMPDALMNLLSDMGIISKNVTPGRLNDLRYMVRRTSETVASIRHGVVILDCRSSIFVDRPIVISIGLDDLWNPQYDDTFDPVEARQRAMDALSLLMQQGDHRYRLVVGRVAGTPVRPADLIVSISSARTFNDLPGEDVCFPAEETSGVDDDRQAPPMDPGALSPSDLNLLLSCPSRYMFSRLVGTRMNSAMHKGTVVHWMAEVLVEWPDTDPKALIDAALEQLTATVSSRSLMMARTEMVLAEEGLQAFFSSKEMVDVDGVGEVTDRRSNPLAEGLGLTPFDPRVEQRFLDEKLGVRGVMDLMLSPDCIIDHKTGRKRGTRKLATGMTPAIMGEVVDVQAPVYLSYLRSRGAEGELTMIYDHCLDDIEGRMLKNRCGETVTVRCMPGTMADCMTRDEFWGLLGSSKEKRAAITEVGAELLSRLAIESPPGPTLRTVIVDDTDPFVITLKKTVADPDMILSAIVDLRLGKGAERDVLTIFQDDLDDIVRLAAECRVQMANWWPNGFPAEPRSERTCERCEFRDLCPGEVMV